MVMTEYERSGVFRQKENLCTSCARICMGDTEKGCSWSAELKPVKGWEAIPIYSPDGSFYTWQVNRCPKFIRGIYRPLCNEEGVVRLLEQAMTIARKDYISNRESDRKAIEMFIQKFVPDCEGGIEALRKAAAEHDKQNNTRRIRACRWIVFNENTVHEFAECEDCGHEVTSDKTYYSHGAHKRYYPDHCPQCGAITVRRVKAEDL